MKIIFVICMLAFSTIAFAEVTAKEIQESANAMKNCRTDRECSNAYQNNRAVSQQFDKQMLDAMNRTPEQNATRNRVRDEERYRDEYRGR